jgi:predicted HTH transcriptional regulator
VLVPEEIEAALSSGYEVRGLELKGPGPRTDAHLFAKVTRAALSMGNLRDGGHVIIGIDDGDPSMMLPGLEAIDLRSWLAYDDVARRLAEYADPPLRFDIARIELASGVNVAVIQVFEFSDTPHLCAKDFPKVLRKGALYVRPRKVPETSEVASLVEMRDIIQLATEKALRAYIETAERAGLTLATSAQELQGPTDDEKYEAERERGWS